MELSIRALNCLEKAGILTVQQLLNLSDAELLSLPGLGIVSLEKIKCKKKQLPELMKRKIGILENELEKNGTEIQKLQAKGAILSEDLDFARSILNG
jgi:DNA-directed RNA polymerase alpha subunit